MSQNLPDTTDTANQINTANQTINKLALGASHSDSMLSVELSRGTLQLWPVPVHADWPLPHLLDFAERINPRRSFLFVSKVLGKHIPVAPSQMQKTYTDLAALVPAGLTQPVTVIAMAETALCLGAGVHQALQDKYPDSVLMATTRHPLHDQPLLAEFREEHSHAQAQLLYGAQDAQLQQQILNTKTLILVDDEASTGKTFVNLVTALQQAGLQDIQQIITITLVNWSPQQDIVSIPTTHVTLLQGEWQWQPNPAASVPQMPRVDQVAHGHYPIVAPQQAGRIPTYQPHNSWIKASPRFVGERILVIGTCEYVWPPFLAALALEQQGAVVHFSSTTRSPISLGHAIGAKLSFNDNYGLGMPNYIYNIYPEQYDRILLIAETAADSIDPELLAKLPNAEVIAYV